MGNAFHKPDASEPLPPVVERVSTGRCKHGRALRETCGECERAWYRRPRVALADYDDIHVEADT